MFQDLVACGRIGLEGTSFKRRLAPREYDFEGESGAPEAVCKSGNDCRDGKRRKLRRLQTLGRVDLGSDRGDEDDLVDS